MSQVFLGRPEFVPGTPPWHPTAKFLYVIFLYRVFFSPYPSPLKLSGDYTQNSAQVSSGLEGLQDF